MKKKLRLLSVDFDAFFEKPESGDGKERSGQWMLYDWGHQESPFMMGTALWSIRAATFLRQGLPLPPLNGKEKHFWERVDICGAEVFFAESHCEICQEPVLRGVTDVVSYDAHHDAGYQEKPLERILQERTVSCEDWVVYAYTRVPGSIEVVYPPWRAHALRSEKPTSGFAIPRRVDDGREHFGRFDRVFICRSGAWVPPWCDADFARFTAETVTTYGAGSIECLDALTERDFDAELCQALAEDMGRALAFSGEEKSRRDANLEA